MYNGVVPKDQWARSFQRPSWTTTTTGGREKRQVSSGGVMGLPPPLDRGGRRDDPKAGPSRALTPSRLAGSEGES